MYSCHEVFLTEVFYRKVEKNRIDFPKQIRIKRKYLKSRDDDVREKLRKIEFCADVRSTPKILPDARRRKET